MAAHDDAMDEIDRLIDGERQRRDAAQAEGDARVAESRRQLDAYVELRDRVLLPVLNDVAEKLRSKGESADVEASEAGDPVTEIRIGTGNSRVNPRARLRFTYSSGKISINQSIGASSTTKGGLEVDGLTDDAVREVVMVALREAYGPRGA